jgi:hypothetical protein
MSEPNLNDVELEALMAELEAQNAEIMAAAKEAPKAEKTVEKSAAAETKTVEEVAEELDVSKPAIPAATIVAETEKQTEEMASEKAVIAQPEQPTLERRVIVDEDGEIKQSPPSFADKKPQRPTETTGPGPLQHYVDVDQFREDTHVSDINLDKCLIEQAGLRAYYGAQAARAEAQAARVKAKFEVVEATLYDHHRKQLALTGEKTTEKMVENAVKLDPRWLKAKNLVIEADTISSINRSLVESLKDRRDMLIQLGADRRDEFKGAARVLAEQGERDELRDRALRAMQGRTG